MTVEKMYDALAFFPKTARFVIGQNHVCVQLDFKLDEHAAEHLKNLGWVTWDHSKYEFDWYFYRK